MRKSDDDTGLNLGAIAMAASCARAFAWANGQTPQDDLDPAEAYRWQRAVMLALDWLPTMDGRPVSEGVDRMVADYAEGDEILKAREAGANVAWEAVVRHLNCLLDADDLEDEDDARALERSWADWARSRKPRIEVLDGQ